MSGAQVHSVVSLAAAETAEIIEIETEGVALLAAALLAAALLAAALLAAGLLASVDGVARVRARASFASFLCGAPTGGAPTGGGGGGGWILARPRAKGMPRSARSRSRLTSSW